MSKTPRWYQLEDALEARRRKKVMVRYPMGLGKCLGIGTPVLLASGHQIAVEDVQPNDDLLGPDGLPRRVLATISGQDEMVWIVPRKGYPWSCTLDHILVLTDTSTGREQEISVRDYLALPKWKQNYLLQFTPPEGIEDFPGEREPLPVDPYLIGLWLGDGTKNLNGVEITKPDLEVKEYLEEYAKAHNLSMTTHMNTSDCPTFALVTPAGKPNPLLTTMRELFGRGVERIPQEYLTATKGERQKLLAGLLDSDGHFIDKVCEITQKREIIAKAIAFIARSLGFRVTTHWKFVDHNLYYRLFLSGDFTQLPMRIARKIQGPRQQKKRVTVTNFFVEPCGVQPFYGFTLDGDGRFLLGDFTVTHNSELASLAIWEPGVFDATPCLIASQNQSVPDWEDHLREEFPQARIAVVAEQTPEVKRELLGDKYDFYLVNHAMLSVPARDSKRATYQMPKVKSFVLDESHEKGVGRKSLAWRGARAIADRAEIVLPMSGTPIRKTADGLWAQLRLVDRTLTSYWRFVREHCITEETPWKVEILGARDSMQDELAKRSLYRTYSEVGLSLPDVIPYHHRVKMAPNTAELYKRLKNDLRDEFDQPVFSAGAALSRLRRYTAHDEMKRAKLAACVEDLDQYVVFTWHRETAEMLAKEFKGIAVTGEKSGRDRNALAKSSNRVFATIASMSTSVDLSHHRDVIFYEESTEPGVMDNALGRVARWRKAGGDEPIRCRYIFCSGTIDERIHNLQSGRAVDAEQVYRSDRELIAAELADRMLT